MYPSVKARCQHAFELLTYFNVYGPKLILWEIVPGKMGPFVEGFVQKSNAKSIPERLIWWSGMLEANMKATN